MVSESPPPSRYSAALLVARVNGMCTRPSLTATSRRYLLMAGIVATNLARHAVVTRYSQCGRCEGSGKSVGRGCLDGLTLGCDHSGVFHLKGSIAELRVFHCHLQVPTTTNPPDRATLQPQLTVPLAILRHSILQYLEPSTNTQLCLSCCTTLRLTAPTLGRLRSELRWKHR